MSAATNLVPRPSVTISRFASVNDPQVRSVTTCEWDAVVASFSQPQRYRKEVLSFDAENRKYGKPHNLGGYAFVSFAGGRRANDNVEAVSVLSLDDDSGKHTAEDHAKALPYAGVILPSFNSTREIGRFRIHLPLSRPVTPTEYGKLWKWASDVGADAGIDYDPAPKDAGRFWYNPAIVEGEPWEVPRIEGPVLDVDAVLAAEEREGSLLAVAALNATGPCPPPIAEIGKRSRTEKRARAYVDQIPPAIQGEGGSARTMGVASIVVRGFALGDSDAAREIVSDYGARCLPKWSDAEIRKKVSDAAQKGRMAWGCKLNETRPANDNQRERTQLLYVAHMLGRTVEDAIEVLARTIGVYARDGALVHVTRSDEDASPTIRTLRSATLRELLSRVAVVVQLEKVDGESGDESDEDEGGSETSGRFVKRMTRAPNDLIDALLARGEWPGVAPLLGVTEAPVLRGDGTVLDVPGYDRASGFLYCPSVEFPKVPANPTREDARRALDILRTEVFGDFPHVSDAHKMVPIAAILTMLARPAIDGSVPAFLLDSTGPGTGKGLQADAASHTATGRAAAKSAWPSKPEELEKVLGSHALRGTPLILFDNVTTTFTGGALDLCLTSGGRVNFRILGQSEAPDRRWNAVILATGNNLEVHGDTRRRVLVSRLESDLENPEARQTFRHENLLEWVRANRPHLVVAGLTILRAYAVAAFPKVRDRTWGSFESWDRLIPNAIVWAGGADPTDTRLDIDGNARPDPRKAAHLTILEQWPRLANGRDLTAKEAIDALYSSERRRGGEVPPDGFDELRDAVEYLTRCEPGKVNANHLGRALSQLRGRVAGNKKLVSKPDRNGTQRWCVETVESVPRTQSA